MDPATCYAMIELKTAKNGQIGQLPLHAETEDTGSNKVLVTGKVTSGATADPGANATAPHLIYRYDRHDGVPQGPGEEVTLF